jgi:hypothetical protein
MKTTMPSGMRQRDAELPDLDAEEQRLEPVADVGAGEAPLQHQERQGGDDGAKVSASSVSRASWLRRGASRPKRASSIRPPVASPRLARHRPDGEIEQAPTATTMPVSTSCWAMKRASDSRARQRREC